MPSPCRVRLKVLAESWRTSATVAVSVACLILHTSEDAGMFTTQSLLGCIWQVST